MSRRPGARALAAAAVAVLLPLLALPLAAPPAAALNPGDWFVTGIQSVEDQTKVMNGSILVMAGAVLTVRNATIEFTLPIEGLYNITVHAGGTLIMERCTVRSAVEGLHYNFFVSGRLEVRNCDISGLRGDATLGGLDINSNQYTIENSTFHHNEYFGLVIRSGSGTVRNTTFDHHTVAIFVTRSMESQMMGQSFPMNVNEWVIAPLFMNMSVLSLFLIPMIGMRLSACARMRCAASIPSSSGI